MRKINPSKLDLRFRGYYKGFRGSYLLLKNGILTTQEYLLWRLSFDALADWDLSPERADTFGSFPHTNPEIAYYLACDPSSISRNSQKLFKLGLWKKRDDGRIEVCGFDIIKKLTKMTHKHIVNIQDYIANPHIYDALITQQNVKTHSKATKENVPFSPQTDAHLHQAATKDPLISSKDESDVSFVKKVIVRGSVKSIEEYQKDYEEDGGTGMPPEDRRDIDESLSESYEVTEENEQWLIDTFFDGDSEKYKRNLQYMKKVNTEKSGL